MENELLLKNIEKNNLTKNSAITEKHLDKQTIASNVAMV